MSCRIYFMTICNYNKVLGTYLNRRCFRSKCRYFVFELGTLQIFSTNNNRCRYFVFDLGTANILTKICRYFVFDLGTLKFSLKQQ